MIVTELETVLGGVPKRVFAILPARVRCIEGPRWVWLTHFFYGRNPKTGQMDSWTELQEMEWICEIDWY